MRNYIEKQRDMCRSILPATNRRSARFDAAVIKRHNRRATRMTLREWATYENPYDFEGHTFDTTDATYGGCGYNQTITEVMWSRRDHDKAAPLVRWTERLVETKFKDVPENERAGYFKNMLPNNLIGRHAWSHIDHLFPDNDEFNVFRFRGPYLSDRERREQNKAARQARIEEWTERLRAIIAGGYHREFNRNLPYMKVRRDGEEVSVKATPLAGLHDCERFAADYLYNRKIEKYIEKWESVMA